MKSAGTASTPPRPEDRSRGSATAMMAAGNRCAQHDTRRMPGAMEKGRKSIFTPAATPDWVQSDETEVRLSHDKTHRRALVALRRDMMDVQRAKRELSMARKRPRPAGSASPMPCKKQCTAMAVGVTVPALTSVSQNARSTSSTPLQSSSVVKSSSASPHSKAGGVRSTSTYVVGGMCFQPLHTMTPPRARPRIEAVESVVRPSIPRKSRSQQRANVTIEEEEILQFTPTQHGIPIRSPQRQAERPLAPETMGGAAGLSSGSLESVESESGGSVLLPATATQQRALPGSGGAPRTPVESTPRASGTPKDRLSAVTMTALTSQVKVRPAAEVRPVVEQVRASTPARSAAEPEILPSMLVGSERKDASDQSPLLLASTGPE